MQVSEPSSCSIISDAVSNLSLITTTSSLSPSTFPLNILVMILKRVPVKSVLSLKRTSKPWRSCLSTPEFISMHLKETAIDPQNHCFLIHYINSQNYNFMCRLNINSTDSKVDCSLNPFLLNYFEKMDLVGSINGLLCVSAPPQGQKVCLWNRALDYYHSIWRSEYGLFWGGDVLDKVSLGFAYDPVTDDYKVVRIAVLISNALSPNRTHAVFPEALTGIPLYMTRAEVYSLNLGDWETVDFRNSQPFSVSSSRCNVVVNGIPYWVGKLYKDNVNQSRPRDVLIWYDMVDKSFKHVPMPKTDPCMGTGAKLVEWKGSLAMILYTPQGRKIGSYVHVLVFDEKEKSWNKAASRYGPIRVKMEKVIQCSKDGVILGETQGGKLFLYDHLTNAVKEYSVPRGSERLCYKALSHTDSLVSSKKFKPCFERL